MTSLADRNVDPPEDLKRDSDARPLNIQRRDSKHDEPTLPLEYSFVNNDEDKDATVPTDDLMCEHCAEVGFGTIHSHQCSCYNKLILVSTVGEVFANKRCPSCRLITHLVRSKLYSCPIPEATRVTLHLNQYHFSEHDDTPSESEELQRPYWIEVGMDTHELNHGNGTKFNLGSILPVMEDEKDESNSDKYYEGMFSASKHDGYVYARRLLRKVNIKIITAWMDFCENSHGICTAPTSKMEVETPVRLIDVQERCIVTSTLKETYLALSYVWGSGISGLLTNDTFEKYQRKGSLNKEVVPRTISDAMELTVALGERYIWVDTACIIQDDIFDQQRQLPIMDAIYRHAKLVIIAAVRHANAGLPRWNECGCETRASPETIEGINFTTGKAGLDLVLKQTTWNSRGWTFQEGLVAQRALVFTCDQVYWTCRRESWCEDRHTEFKDVRHVPTNQNALFASTSIGPACGQPYSTSIRSLCPMAIYRERVKQYSKRQFSNYSDIVWAFVGILKGLRIDFPKGFIWALPYDHLDAALLWDTCCVSHRFPEHTVLGDKGNFRQLSIPSWCWIAKGHQLMYNDCCTNSIVSLVEWHDPVQYAGRYDIASHDEILSRTFKAPVFLGPAAPQLEPSLLHFALLRFTAQTARLVLKPDTSTEAYERRYGKRRRQGAQKMSARIQLPSGKDIGQMFVPKRVFTDRLEERREFVLLSKQEGDHCRFNEQDHVENEDLEDGAHLSGVNIMLIHWCKNEHGADIAIRIGIARIEEGAWSEVDAKRKEIILG